jgi:recombinational DNA repair protein RecR
LTVRALMVPHRQMNVGPAELIVLAFGFLLVFVVLLALVRLVKHLGQAAPQLSPCRACGRFISSQAAACPACGQPR